MHSALRWDSTDRLGKRMSYAKYCELVDGLCRLVGIPDPSRLYQQAELTVNGEDCILMHGGEYNEEGIAIYCIFGEPPDEHADRIRQRLLEANLTAMQPGGMRYALNPETDEVMLAGVLPMEELDPEQLLLLLARFAHSARLWRQHYFLGTEPNAEPYVESSPLSIAARTRRLS